MNGKGVLFIFLIIVLIGERFDHSEGECER